MGFIIANTEARIRELQRALDVAIQRIENDATDVVVDKDRAKVDALIADLRRINEKKVPLTQPYVGEDIPG